MKAVIMAGGEGTRLRPLTCDIPKPLAPLCGKPVLDYILDLLAKHGFENAVVTLRYLGRQIVEHFDDPLYKGVSLEFMFEDSPLGTAGSVKNALNGHTEDFLVISGDALCDFNLTKAIAFHREKGAMATLLVKKVEDPREYGLVNAGSDGRITGFLEKPGLSHCTSDLANTGIYILSPQVLDLIDAGKSVDFAKDVFPKMLVGDMPIYAFEDSGYWCDIGDLQSYIHCQQDILNGKVDHAIEAQEYSGIFTKEALPDGIFTIEAPCYIGENVKIGSGTKIRGGSVISNNVTIGSNCKIQGSILLDGVNISNSVSCVSSLLCSGASVGRNSSVYEYSVLGANAVVGEDTHIADTVKVWANKAVPDHTTLHENLQYGRAPEIICDEKGICGETNFSINPALCTKIGASVASLPKASSVAVACSDSTVGVSLKLAAASGILSAGADSWDFGISFESQFAFCMQKSQADYGIFINASGSSAVEIYGKKGIPLLRKDERSLEGFINRSEYKRAHHKDFGRYLSLFKLNHMYEIDLLMTDGNSLDGLSADIKTSNPLVRRIAASTLQKLGCSLDSNGIHLHISNDGRRLAVYTEKSGYVFSDRVLTLVCLFECLSGKDVVVPYSAPQVIDAIAEDNNRRAYRYYSTPHSAEDMEVHAMTITNASYSKDGLVMAVKLLHYLKYYSLTFDEALKKIPAYTTRTKVVQINDNASKVMRRLNKGNVQAGEGITIASGDGNVRVRPLKSGRAIMLITESARAEIAEELCDTFASYIQEDDPSGTP